LRVGPWLPIAAPILTALALADRLGRLPPVLNGLGPRARIFLALHGCLAIAAVATFTPTAPAPRPTPLEPPTAAASNRPEGLPTEDSTAYSDLEEENLSPATAPAPLTAPVSPTGPSRGLLKSQSLPPGAMKQECSQSPRPLSINTTLKRRLDQLAPLTEGGSASLTFRMFTAGQKKEGRSGKAGVRRKVVPRMGAVLGSGAFGTVRICLDEATGELLAAKLVECSNGPTLRVKLLELETELMVMKRLAHPSLVTYVALERRPPSTVCIYMEYVPGGSLASLLEAFGPLTNELAARYIVDVLDGVVFLHENNIIHRDIKGANILLSTSGEAKLADFGSASLLASLTAKATGCHGTISWMAPEVFQGREYGYDVDTWSIGATVMELLTARRPWALAGLSGIQLVKLFADNEPPPWDRYEDACCPAALAFMQQCMNVVPAERPPVGRLVRHPYLRGASTVSATTALRAFCDAWTYFLLDRDTDGSLQKSFDEYCAEILHHRSPNLSPARAVPPLRTPSFPAAEALGLAELPTRCRTGDSPTPTRTPSAGDQSRIRAVQGLEATTRGVELRPEWHQYLVDKDHAARQSVYDVAMHVMNAKRSGKLWALRARRRASGDDSTHDEPASPTIAEPLE